MATPAIPPPLGPDYNRGPQLLALTWVFSGTAILTQLGRLYCRLRMRNLGLDDYLMFFTTVLDTCYSSILTVYVANGGARHAFYLFQKEPQVVPFVSLMEWVSQPFLIIALGTGKASVGFLLLRLFPKTQKWQRWVIWACIITANVVLVLAVILTFVQCNPPAKLWNPSLEGTCWSPEAQNDYAMFSAAYSAAMDIILAVIPLTVFGTLKVSLKNRIGLSVLFSFGCLAGIAGFYKTSVIPGIANDGDFTWNSYTPDVWSQVETWLVIISGTLPTLKPLWDQLRGKTTAIPRSRYYATKGYTMDGSQDRATVAMYSRKLGSDGFESGAATYHDPYSHPKKAGGIRVDETFAVNVNRR